MTSATLPTDLAEREDLDWESIDFLESEPGWTEEQYLRIDVNRIIEYVDGCLEVPPVPDEVHQALVYLFCRLLNDLLVEGEHGKALPSSFKLKIPNGNWREPDVVYLLPKNLHRRRRQWWDYADLAIEIVSPDRPARDYEDKQLEYARVGVPEYWIVDPLQSQVTVLVLSNCAYVKQQVGRTGDIVRSVVVPGLELDVGATFAEANE